MPGRLVPLNARGKLPSSVLPNLEQAERLHAHPDREPEPRPRRGGARAGRDPDRNPRPSAANPYLIKIEPGIYDLEANSLFMRPYVDIEGSGEGVTTITSAVNTGLGTVVGADNSELRFLTVKNTGEPGQQVVRPLLGASSPRYTHVTAAASGGTENDAIHISNGTPVLSYVTASASGGSRSTGVANFGGLLIVSNSTFSAADAANTNLGVLSTFGGTGPGKRARPSAPPEESSPSACERTTGTIRSRTRRFPAVAPAESYGIYNGWRLRLRS